MNRLISAIALLVSGANAAVLHPTAAPLRLPAVGTVSSAPGLSTSLMPARAATPVHSGAALAPILAAPAAPTPAESAQIRELNAVIAEVLSPFNTRLTNANVTVQRAATNESRAIELSVLFDYARKGEMSDAAINGRADYSYPEAAGSVPKGSLAVAAELDLVKLVPQSEINRMALDADRMAKDFIKDQTSRYPEAATADARVTRLDRDADNNVTALGLTLNAAVDLSKLPADVDVKSVMLTSLRAAFEITLKKFTLDISITANPNASNFGQHGIKDYIEQLLARDPRVLRSIKRLVTSLDDIAKQATKVDEHSRRAFVIKDSTTR